MEECLDKSLRDRVLKAGLQKQQHNTSKPDTNIKERLARLAVFVF
jgi:hypothetical protein